MLFFTKYIFLIVQSFNQRSVGIVVGAPIIKQWRKSQSNCVGSNGKHWCLSNTFTVDDFSPRDFDLAVLLNDRICLEAGYSAIAIAAKVHRAFTFQQIEGDMIWNTASEEYPAGGYFIEVPIEVSNTNQRLISSSWIVETLPKAQWVDNFTSALAFEAAVYSPVHDRISTIRLIVEFPPGAGTLTTAAISTFKISSWNFRYRPSGYFTIDSITPFVELTIFVAVLYFAFLSDLVKSQPAKYLDSYFKRRPLKELSGAYAVWVFIVVDICCICTLGYAFIMEFTLRRNVERTSRTSNWGPTGRYISIRELEHTVMAQVQLLSR
jgi:hypothetical protein